MKSSAITKAPQAAITGVNLHSNWEEIGKKFEPQRSSQAPAHPCASITNTPDLELIP
jgi:hypothetical protein